MELDKNNARPRELGDTRLLFRERIVGQDRAQRMASFFRTYRTADDGERIDGEFAMAFIHNFDFHRTHISIYRDGMVDCLGLVMFRFPRAPRSRKTYNGNQRTRFFMSAFSATLAMISRSPTAIPIETWSRCP
jgi:hypothetical protein